MEVLNMNLNKDDPDYLLELFWLGLKQSMINFYEDKTITTLSRCVMSWSTRLNYLKTRKKYTEIEYAVYNYLSLYGIDVLRSGDLYYLRLLNTNIKRWDKICSNKVSDKKEYQNCMLMLLDISFKLFSKSRSEKEKEEIKLLFKDVELYLMYEDFQMLIEYALKHKKTSILDTLITYDADIIYSELEIILGTNTVGLSGKKIMLLIK
jgi:hypothetical protein